MKLTKEQRFLYNRVAILVCAAVAVAFLFAGVQGFAYWFGGFVPTLWLSLALFNYAENSSLWLLLHKRSLFLRFYAALALSFFVIDHIGLQVHLWFSPLYAGWGGGLLVYGLLLPLCGLVLVEILSVLFRELRFSLLILAGTFLVAGSLAVLPNTHLREWVYLGKSFAAFSAFSLLGLPLFAWLGSFLVASVPLLLWHCLVLPPKMK